MHRIHAIGRVSPAFKSNEILIVGYTITVIFGPKSSKIGRSEGLSGNHLKIRFLNCGEQYTSLLNRTEGVYYEENFLTQPVKDS